MGREQLSTDGASGAGLFVALLLYGVASPAVADGGVSTAALDDIVVTGTRSERPVLDAPVRTELVSRRELERTHARSLKEGLENVTGLQLREIHGKPGHEVVLQGLSGDQVLVLVDGLPLTATTGSTVDVSQLAVLDVERIEIVKGALSAQYGSAAMGGVVNVITRGIRPGLSGEFRGDVGSFGAQNPSGDRVDAAGRHAGLRLEGGGERYRLRLTGDRRARDGIDPQPDRWSRPGDAVDRDQVDLRGEWHPSPSGQFHLQAGRYDERSDSRYELALPGGALPQSRNERATRDRLHGGGRWHWRNGVGLRMHALEEMLEVGSRKHADGQRFDERDARIGLGQISAHSDIPLGSRQHLQIGGDLHRENLRQSKDGESEVDGARVRRDSREVWGQWNLLTDAGPLHALIPAGDDAVELVLGLRTQRDSDFGGHTAGNAGLRLRLWDGAASTGSLRLGWGQGYRVPNLKERHFRFDHSQLGYVVIGNPALEPEHSQSLQLGWAHAWGQRLWLEAGVFGNRLRNLIQVDADNATVDGNGIQQFRYDNVDRARTRGVELGVQARPASWLRLGGGYTYLRAEDRDTGMALTRRPRHQGRASIDLMPRPGTSLLLRLRTQSEEVVDSTAGTRSPAWTVLDLRLNHELGPALALYAGLDNLFNRQRDFADPADFGPVAGRYLYVGARYRFGNESQ